MLNLGAVYYVVLTLFCKCTKSYEHFGNHRRTEGSSSLFFLHVHHGGFLELSCSGCVRHVCGHMCSSLVDLLTPSGPWFISLLGSLTDTGIKVLPELGSEMSILP